MVWTPISASRARVTGPTPHINSTGRSWRKSNSVSGSTTTSPSGLATCEAIFARCLVRATRGSTTPRFEISRGTIFLRATEPLKLRKGYCSREVRTQPFGQTRKFASMSYRDQQSLLGEIVMVEPGSPLLAFSDHAAELVERAAGNVVAVQGGGRWPSSGIHWRSGVIVTAEEVLERDENIKLTLPGGRVADASLAGRDPTTDVAVLRFQPNGLPVATTS